MTKAVLWDLDGTLVDSLAHHWQSWLELMTSEGAPLSYEQFTSTFGKRNDEILDEWFQGTLDAGTLRRLSLAKEARFRELVRAKGLSPLPGAAEWVARLKAAGWKQAIGTSAPRLNLEAMVDALGMADWFDAQVAAEDVVNGKPDPEVFLTAAARVGTVPARSIVVEDAVPGVEAGRRAGMRTIGVRPGAPIPGATLVAVSLLDLPEDTFERLILG